MAKDPYRYFRIEGRDLIDGLAATAPALLEPGGRADALAKVLRLAHTLKGAARVVKASTIADEAHAIESLLADCRDHPEHLEQRHVAAILAASDRLSSQLGELGNVPLAATTPAPAPATSAGETAATVSAMAPSVLAGGEGLHSVRVATHDLDRLLDGLSDLRLRLRGMDEWGRELDALCRQLRGKVEQAPDAVDAATLSQDLRGLHRRFEDALDGWRHDLDDLRDDAAELRLLPLDRVYGELARTVREAASERGLDVALTLGHGDCRIDARVLGPLRDALIQLLRNAVAHGIEPAAQRLAAGKPAQGQIRIDVTAHGEQVTLRCQDDGRGVDFAAIRRRLAENGTLTASEASRLDERSLLDRLLRGGISTANQVSALSGRGIGLDLVRDAVDRTQGRLDVHSEQGRGTRWDIEVPVSLLSLPVLQLRCGGQRYCLPQSAIRRACRVGSAQRSEDSDGARLALDGQLIPLRSLAALLDESEPECTDSQTVLVVGDGEHRAALAVEALLGIFDTVIRPLPADLAPLPVVAGVGIDPYGDPLPMLNVDALLAEVRDGAGRSAASRPHVERPPVLVIDDSLTTRMMEQSILEAAGYAVELATSADQALARDDLARFRLFVCDVEMPGRDGFTFVAEVRQDPALRSTPCILVTSRGSREDRERGHAAGADAYVVKGEFDQQQFLATVARLLARE